jgi:hypothetical protein
MRLAICLASHTKELQKNGPMKRLLSSSFLAAALLPLSAFASDYTFSTSASALTDMVHGSAVTWGLSGSTNPANYNALYSDINGGGKVVTSATLTLTGIYDWQGEGVGQDPADALFVNILAGLNAGVSSKAFIPNDTANDANWNLAITNKDPFLAASSYNAGLHSGTSLVFTNADSSPSNATNSLLTVTGSTDPLGLTKAGTPGTVTWSDPSGGTNGGTNGPTTLTLSFSSANLSLLNALLDADTSNGGTNVGLGFAAECAYIMTGATLNITTSTAPSVPDSGSTVALMGLGLAALVGFRRAKKQA